MSKQNQTPPPQPPPSPVRREKSDTIAPQPSTTKK
jgi:hypothetical protein